MNKTTYTSGVEDEIWIAYNMLKYIARDTKPLDHQELGKNKLALLFLTPQLPKPIYAKMDDTIYELLQTTDAKTQTKICNDFQTWFVANIRPTLCKKAFLTKNGITLATNIESNQETRDELLTNDYINHMLSNGATTKHNLTKKPLNRENYIASIHEMYDKIEKIMSNELPFNIIDYLPKKKNGKLDLRKKPFVAVCPYGIFENDMAPICNTIVAQITPESDTEARLDFWYYAQVQTAPYIILQDINNPIDPNTIVTVKPLKQDTIKAGFIYENDKGKQYLYLGAKTAYYTPDHCYVAYTKKLEKQLNDNNVRDYNDFINYMKTTSNKKPQLFSSGTPRKFIKEINCRLTNYSNTPDNLSLIFYGNCR